jgi:hypothetical protein
MRMLTTVAIPPWQETAALEQLMVLCREAGISDVAVMVQVHPEAEPLLAKIDDAADRFRRVRTRLQAEGVAAGILLQTILDHGERGFPYSPAPFQRIVGADGAEARACFCPLDLAFRAYVGEAVARLAAAGPDFMIVDDDTRTAPHHPASRGCCCPLHLALHAQRTGQAFTREALLAQVARDDDDGLAVREAWAETQREGLFGLLGVVRAAIDAVDPALRGGIAVCSNQLPHAEAMARLLAGSARPLLRLGTAYYLENGYKGFAGVMAQLAHQRARLGADIECLSEADTWPQTRYSLSATGLRGYIIAAALAGAEVAQTWVTNLMEWGADEGRAYREMLRDSRAVIDVVQALAGQVEWQGPVALQDMRQLSRAPWMPYTSDFLPAPQWAGMVFGRLGLPFRTAGDGVRLLAGNAPLGFTRDALRGFLAGGLLLDGPAARHIARLGLGEYLGVAVEDADLRPNFEQFADDADLNGPVAGARHYLMRLDPSHLARLTPQPGTRVASWLMSWPGFQSLDQQRLAPALTLAENALGGRVAVYAHSIAGFPEMSFLSEHRKVQLTRVLAWLGAPLPAYTLDTADAYVQYGRLAGGDDLLLIVNANTDPISPLRLHLARGVPARAEALDDDGVWRPCALTCDGEDVRVPCTLPTMRPLLLRLGW